MAIFLNKAFVVEMIRREQSNLDSHKCPEKILRQTKFSMNLINKNSLLTWKESTNLF
jgi:hypothetical protein